MVREATDTQGGRMADRVPVLDYGADCRTWTDYAYSQLSIALFVVLGNYLVVLVGAIIDDGILTPRIWDCGASFGTFLIPATIGCSICRRLLLKRRWDLLSPLLSVLLRVVVHVLGEAAI